MAYHPRADSTRILAAAWYWVQSVPYDVTARWVFYRLLQEAIYRQKDGYKHLLGLLSKARKGFYQEWRPHTLADDSRAALVRGGGYSSPADWLEGVKTHLLCTLDHWLTQPVYVECWFEAAAMEAQFRYYANENIPLLAFHGDISIPEKWKAAERLADRWAELRKTITIYYFGDLDPKGLVIPESAWDDIGPWAVALAMRKTGLGLNEVRPHFRLHRVGLNSGQEIAYSLPENPERPGTYQWEALSDDDARHLIAQANTDLDLEAFAIADAQEQEAAQEVRDCLDDLEL